MIPHSKINNLAVFFLKLIACNCIYLHFSGLFPPNLAKYRGLAACEKESSAILFCKHVQPREMFREHVKLFREHVQASPPRWNPPLNSYFLLYFHMVCLFFPKIAFFLILIQVCTLFLWGVGGSTCPHPFSPTFG